MEKKPFITIYEAIAGWKAQLMWWNNEEPELGGFWEPWETSFFGYPTPQQAEEYAIAWAKSENVEYKRPANVHI